MTIACALSTAASGSDWTAAIVVLGVGLGLWAFTRHSVRRPIAHRCERLPAFPFSRENAPRLSDPRTIEPEDSRLTPV